MNLRNNERLIITLISIGCIGLSVESLILGWEYWVPPLLMIGVVSVWGMHITGNPEYKLRQVAYLAYVMLMTFYHGVHETSFLDVALVSVLVLIAFSLFDKIYMLNLIFAEFWVMFAIQIFLAGGENAIEFDALVISKLILRVAIVIMVFLFA